jgi:proteic killer suppression protein
MFLPGGKAGNILRQGWTQELQNSPSGKSARRCSSEGNDLARAHCHSPFAVVCSCHIRSWRNSAARKVWDGERPNQFRGLDFEAAVDLLLALNVAKSLGDLSPLKSLGLHKLKGDRRGQWAMTVNDRWRICFEFRKGDAYEVEIVDYHRG